MSQSQSDNLSFRDAFRGSGLSGRIALILSTWFGTGLCPLAPGTCGTLGALPLVILGQVSNRTTGILILMGCTAAALWSSKRAGEILGSNDPPAVVIDEAAGFLLTMIFLPFSWPVLCLGFVLFRLFDILKPFPIRRLERLGHGFGIVLDDLLAGLYAYASARLILLFVQGNF